MNESIIYKLSTRHQSTDDDKLKLVYRIRAEHVFISVTECIEYIKYAVEDIYNKTDVSIVDINIIDEAICAIIKEVFVTPVEDEHNRSFYRWKCRILTCNTRHFRIYRVFAQFLFRPPLPVQIAVFAGVNVGCVGHEHSLGLFAGAEVAALCLVAFHQLDPFNVMIVEHRVLHAAHGHAVAAVDFLDYGHMFLCGGVYTVLFQQFHGLAAAYQFASCGM